MKEQLARLRSVQQLAERGQFAAIISALGNQPAEEIEGSPLLALLYGMAQARLGSHASGRRWIDRARREAGKRADRMVEARALNMLGAIALEGGFINQAVGHFETALAAASANDDPSIVGRCSNNLGIIAHLRGRYPEAVSSFTRALTAFEQASHRRGIAEVQHNLAISYRDAGDLARALDAADRAVDLAGAVGDRALAAQTRAGRAEVLVALGDPSLARTEIEYALRWHRDLNDVVGEAEDLRVQALALSATGQRAEAERVLREVLDRAEEHQRPLLGAAAGRDLACILRDMGRGREASIIAMTAQATYNQLGARTEARKLDELVENGH